MINANKEKLSSYFIGSVTYEVPFFQRSYVWDEDNWQLFWDHCLLVLEQQEGDRDYEHFIGTIITKQREAMRMGEAVHDLIDGQQRLTTVAVFLRAIRDRTQGVMPRLPSIIEGHLAREDAYGNRTYRISHGKYDRPYFEKVMRGDHLDKADFEHPIPRAYRFFFDRLEGFADERLNTLQQVILEKIPIISMMLSEKDDEQEIFDTINSLGVRLTTGELLKNFLFKEKELQSHYERLWATPFEASEELSDFWGEEKTAGRIIRTNIEVLLYCYLIIKTGREVRIERLFAEYKSWLKGQSVEAKKNFMEELVDYAGVYASFPSGQALGQIGFDEEEKRFFHILENLTITTAYPLVLYIYKTIADADERGRMLRLLEAYLVRRNVCRMTTKNYNQLFMQIISAVELRRRDGGRTGAVGLAEIIAAFDDDSNKVPDDESFALAFKEQVLNNANSREILFVIALKQVSNGMHDVPKLSLSNFSVEHIMPRTWEPNWSDRLRNADEKALRNWKLKTLGNLTLVTGKLNSAMQNAAWCDKQGFLRPNSALRMTTDYLDLPAWDEASIDRRADDLAAVALSIWPR